MRGWNRRVVFLASTMRSGSTLLKALLAEGGDVSHFSEHGLIEYYGREWAVYDVAPQRVLVFKKPIGAEINPNFICRLNVPHMRQIFLVRHPHDVCQSLLKRPEWESRPTGDVLDYWVRSNRWLNEHISRTRT